MREGGKVRGRWSGRREWKREEGGGGAAGILTAQGRRREVENKEKGMMVEGSRMEALSNKPGKQKSKSHCVFMDVYTPDYIFTS